MPTQSSTTSNSSKEAKTKKREVTPPTTQKAAAPVGALSEMAFQQAAADPQTVHPAEILALQRRLGNRSITQLLQAKLKVGPANDTYEQEADRVAEQVMSAPIATASTVQKSADPEEEELQAKPLVQRTLEEEEEVQTKATSGADSFEADADFEQRLSAAHSGGAPLPDETRTFMEPRFGADFSGVRLHIGGEAAQLNRAINARAFTQGQDIYLGAGEEDVESSAGQQLLAHELTHVVQQGASSVLSPSQPQAQLQAKRHITDRPRMIQRNITKGDGWVASRVGSGLSMIGVGWSQTQIDEVWKKIKDGHASLKRKIEAVEKAATKVTNASMSTEGLSAAKLTYEKWNDKEGGINWAEKDIVLQEIEEAAKAIGGAEKALTEEEEKELGRLQKALTPEIADKLIGDKKYSPKDLTEILGELTAAPLKQIAEPLSYKHFKAIIDYDKVTYANLKKLSSLGGEKVLALCKSGLNLDTLMDVGKSTADQVNTAVTELDSETVEKLQSLGAKYIAESLFTPLGKIATARIAAALDAESARALVKTVKVDAIKGIVEANGDWVKSLYENREMAQKIMKTLPGPDFVKCWKHVTPKLLVKLWDGIEAGKVATLLSEVGEVAVKSLIKDITQEQFWNAAARFGNAALKGMGEAMGGEELRKFTGGLGDAPGVAAVGEIAAPTDEVVTELGENHAEITKSSKDRLTFKTFNIVVRRCQAGGLDADGIADFLENAKKYKWKKEDKLSEFFDKAGANIAAIVTIAQDFEAAGNDGLRPEAGGGGAPTKAVHTRQIATETFKVAEGDIKHYMSGHSYCGYAMTDGNATRGDSSMWDKTKGETDIVADADTVLNSVRFGTWAPGVVGYQETTIGGFRVGLDASSGRMTKLFPTGATILQSRMEAVAKLFQSKGA